MSTRYFITKGFNMLRTLRIVNLTKSVSRFSSASPLSQELKDRIQGYINKDKVVVFMKGTADEPLCGFSRNVKLVLDYHEVPFKGYNVLEDSELREGIKQFSEWPTIPQVYVDREFIGGSDILVQMHKDGEITDFFEKHGVKTKFSDKK
uniref:Glutaredoxin-related protein 5, mitochondrial n=1 Tax=Strongyloides venezuelensis TaxID=75913 RepID=A0A0K0FB80_STRVS